MTASAPRARRLRPRENRPLYLVLFLCGLVTNVFAGNSTLIGLPLAPDRVFFATSIVLFLAEGRELRPRLRWRIVHTFMAAFLLWTIWSALSVGTLGTSLGIFALLDRVLFPFFLFCTAPLLFTTPTRRDLLARTLLLLGAYLGITGIFEVVGPQFLVFPRYIADPALGIQYGRARGPFIASEADGLVLIVAAACGMLGVQRFTGRWRGLAYLCMVVCPIGCFLTLTRSIWAGAVIAIVLIGALTPRLRRHLPAALAAMAVLIIVALNLIPALHDSFTERAETSRSIYDRQNTNAAALRIVDELPLTGVGWVRFVEVSREWVRQSDDYPITNVAIEVHNVVLGRAAELGVPGAVMWVLCVLGGPVRAAMRRTPKDVEDAHLWRVVLIATLSGWSVALMLSPVPYPLPNYLVWLCGGIVLAPWLTRQPVAETPPAVIDLTDATVQKIR